jgi:1,4-alpha-glucan branching enzyme
MFVSVCLLLFSLQGQHDNRPNSFLVYAPSRTCAVYGPSEWADPEADRKPAGIPGLGVKELGPYYEY